MELKTKILKFLAGRPIAILNVKTANKINVHVGERILISKAGRGIISIIDTSTGLINENEIAVSNEIVNELGLKDDGKVEVSFMQKPDSARFIKKKLNGGELGKEEIKEIIKDIVDNALNEMEIAYFVSAVYKEGMTEKETEYLISAMIETGKIIKFMGTVVDKHSIGGIAGNRTTPIVVSICAAEGLVMPKTSSRAITSAAGTADVVESIADVEFTIDELKKIVGKTGACMAWNGILGLSPADDKLIQVERILNLDPEPQLLASVLSKKIAVGSKYVLIDIPYGKFAKVDRRKAEGLKKKFEKFGAKFGLKLRAVLTDGNQPIGNGIGPFLEIADVIKVLKRQGSPKDLEDKAVFLAGQILEFCQKAKKGKGEITARAILDSGEAFKKFRQIIEAQNGRVPSFDELKKKLSGIQCDIISTKNSIIKEIDNKKINSLAIIAGSPMDKGSGLFLYKHVGDTVKKGDKILTIYSESDTRKKNALDFYEKMKPVMY